MGLRKLSVLFLVLVHILMFTTVVYAKDDKQQVKSALEKAASMSNEELYIKAQEEAASGASLKFYSTTSVAAKVSENFARKYPLAVKPTYHSIEDGETYSILTSEINTDAANGPDMALVQNGPDLKAFLLDEELSYNYFPKALESRFAPEYQNPAVVTIISSVLIYNNTGGKLGLNNIWELTEPYMKDNIYFKNPLMETVNMNFLIMLTSPRWTERLRAAYERCYNRTWSSTEYASPAYQWIDGFLKNANYKYTSASKMAVGLADGRSGDMGIMVLSKLRKLTSEQKAKLTIDAATNHVEGFEGFLYPTYATVSVDTDCPYTCALFINYLLSVEGYSSKGSWLYSPGCYSANMDAKNPSGLGDFSLDQAKNCLVQEDAAYIDANYMEVFDFIATRLMD